MLPLKDDNPTERIPIFTYSFIAANIIIWILYQGGGSHIPLLNSICDWGFVPGSFTLADVTNWPDKNCSGPPLQPEMTLFTSMFMHGGWMHLIGNMWFLHIFGNNIEDRMGHIKFILFYLFAGAAAAGLQMLSNPESTIPMVGASGAISGVMGAYLILYPRIRVQTLVVFGFFWKVFRIPAIYMLGYWFLIQMFGGAFSNPTGGGVAYWAHIGGFVAGCGIAWPFKKG